MRFNQGMPRRLLKFADGSGDIIASTQLLAPMAEGTTS